MENRITMDSLDKDKVDQVALEGGPSVGEKYLGRIEKPAGSAEPEKSKYPEKSVSQPNSIEENKGAKLEAVRQKIESMSYVTASSVEPQLESPRIELAENKDTDLLEEARLIKSNARLKFFEKMTGISILDNMGPLVSTRKSPETFRDMVREELNTPLNKLAIATLKDGLNAIKGHRTNEKKEAFDELKQIFRDYKADSEVEKAARKGDFEPVKAKLDEELGQIKMQLKDTVKERDRIKQENPDIENTAKQNHFDEIARLEQAGKKDEAERVREKQKLKGRYIQTNTGIGILQRRKAHIENILEPQKSKGEHSVS